MKLFVLSGCDPAATYMVQRLREAGVLDRLIRIVWREPPPARAPKKPTVARAVRGVVRRFSDAYIDWRRDRINREVSRILFGSELPPEVEADETVDARALHSPEFIHGLEAQTPDLLLVSCAPILEPSVFEVPRLGTLNVHFGIAPEYRGSFTLFWALYRGDYDHLGATLHYIDDGVDSGPIVGYARPDLLPSDSEAAVMAKSAQAATDMVLAYLQNATAAPLNVQPSGGRCYRKRERGPLRDGHLWLKRRLGLVRLPPRARQSVRYS